jgi:hypothetical protein
MFVLAFVLAFGAVVRLEKEEEVMVEERENRERSVHAFPADMVAVLS